jgi:hypothetical protein
MWSPGQQELPQQFRQALIADSSPRRTLFPAEGHLAKGHNIALESPGSRSAKLRDETDLEALNSKLVEVVVNETMQPAHVSVWLRPDTASKGEQAE